MTPRAQGPITSALCWAHARRQFFELADIAANARRDKNAAAISPIALEAVKRIDALFDIERGIKGQSAEERLRIRKEQSVPPLKAVEAWLREQRSRLSNSSSVAKPIDYMLRRWDRFARFIDDRRIVCEEKPWHLGAWHFYQRRNYFAVQITETWWLWAT